MSFEEALGISRIVFPLASAAAPIGAAELCVRAPDASWKPLPEQEFFVPDVRQAWRRISFGGLWPISGEGEHVICWLPPSATETLEGPSANLATVLAVARHERPFKWAFGEIWASGQISPDGSLQSVLNLHHKVKLFLEAGGSGRRLFIASLADQDQLRELRQSHEFAEVEFDPRRPSLPRGLGPTVLWLAADDVGPLLRALQSGPWFPAWRLATLWLGEHRNARVALSILPLVALSVYGTGSYLHSSRHIEIQHITRTMEIRSWQPWTKTPGAPPSDVALDTAVYADSITFSAFGSRAVFSDETTVRGQVFVEYVGPGKFELVNAERYERWSNRSHLAYAVRDPPQAGGGALIRRFRYKNNYPTDSGSAQAGLRIPYDARVVDLGLDFTLIAERYWPKQLECEVVPPLDDDEQKKRPTACQTQYSAGFAAVRLYEIFAGSSVVFSWSWPEPRGD